MKQQENNFQYKSIINLGFWEKTISEVNLNIITDYLYKIKNNTSSVTKSNSGGYQTENNLHLIPEFGYLVNFLNNLVYQLTSNPYIKINGMWGNISSFKDFNYIHTHHTESHKLSGILYLKIPTNSGDLKFHNPSFVDIITKYTPKENTLLIFPSFLPHSVEPNLSQEDRISIAFNFS